MPKYPCIFYLAITVSFCVVQIVMSQNLNHPDIACPSLFEYVCYSNTCFGKVMLPNISYGRTTLKVEFSQRSSVTSGYFGSIKNVDEKDTILFKIAKHEPLTFRVDFPVPNELPKLTKIAVNGMVICSASPYPSPSTYINLNIENFSEITYTKIVGNYFSNMPERGTLPFRAEVQSGNAYGFNTLEVPRSPSQKEITWSPTRSSPPEPIAQPDDQYYFNRFQNEALPSKPVEPVLTRIPNKVEQTPQPSPIEPSMQISSSDICGQENEKPAFVPFISGSIVRPGQFPWLTAVYHRTVGVTTFICGGSLISMRTVLSAAHCFKLTRLTADNTSVSLGRYDLSKSMETSGVTRDIQALHVNAEYDPKTFPDADVAVLIMASPVSFTEFIKPICLWTDPDDVELIINEIGYVAGWGGDANSNVISPLPKMAPATIVSERECRTSSDLLKTFVTSRTICAGQRNGLGPCMGDSGGGLMLKRNGRWVLRGVVSAGSSEFSRCDLKQFAVYCDVVKWSSWIYSKMV